MCDYQCTLYKRQFYHIVESNRIEKSIRQRESNRIELFTPNRNALPQHRGPRLMPIVARLCLFYVQVLCLSFSVILYEERTADYFASQDKRLQDKTS